MSAELTGRPYSSLEEMLDASGGDFLEKVVSGPEISAHMLSGRNVLLEIETIQLLCMLIPLGG